MIAGIYKGDELIGWSYGWQGGIESATYYMANSCVLSKYRRQGLYSLLLQKVIEVSEAMSFQTITSRHVSSNNSVIIAKLKAGFKITGMEISDIFGTLIHLTYYNNDLRSECYEVRSGQIRAKNPILKNLFK